MWLLLLTLWIDEDLPWSNDDESVSGYGLSAACRELLDARPLPRNK